jgi:hypothetical protein
MRFRWLAFVLQKECRKPTQEKWPLFVLEINQSIELAVSRCPAGEVSPGSTVQLRSSILIRAQLDVQ